MSRSSPNPSTSGACNWRDDFVPEEIWIDEDNTMPIQDETVSKDTEMCLYDELFESDINKSREKMLVSSDYEDLKKQVLHLKSLVAEKDSKLTTMTQHYTNVKKNICSLYKTAKIEINHKDSLLAEANSRLDEVLFQRNMTVDQLGKQNPSANHKSFKSNEDRTEVENPKESDVPSTSLSNRNKKTAEQSSAKRKRLSSATTPIPSDSKSAKTDISFQDKNQNSESRNISETTDSVIKDNQNKRQNVSKLNSSKIIKTGDTKANIDNKPSDVNITQQNCEQAPGMNQEPSIESIKNQAEEIFAKLQELAFKDPAATTNAIFFNLLPAELRESFLDFERTQANALNKLKQSFVSCYFSQCSPGTPAEGLENEPRSSTAFFFQDNPSQSKNESCSSSAAIDSSDSYSELQGNISEETEVKQDNDLQKSGENSTSTVKSNSSVQHSKSKPQEIISEETEVKKDSDLQKSAKKSSKRHKPTKNAVKLHKYKDDNLTLYAQRQLNRW